jgi:hypothetical protein
MEGSAEYDMKMMVCDFPGRPAMEVAMKGRGGKALFCCDCTAFLQMNMLQQTEALESWKQIPEVNIEAWIKSHNQGAPGIFLTKIWKEPDDDDPCCSQDTNPESPRTRSTPPPSKKAKKSSAPPDGMATPPPASA